MVVAHDSYLINLAAPDRSLLEKSIDAFRDEMERAEQLGLLYLIMHPGSHTGSGEDSGLRSVASALDRLLKDTSGFRVSILLENTAGQGTALGHKFEHLARLMAEVSDPERMGVCLDTCHAFAAGYDLHDNDGYESVLHELDLEVGLDKLKAIHLNDAKKGLGSRVDRHEHIGRGMLGLECFRLIMTDQRLDTVPKFIETPKQLNGKDVDPVNLGVLRGLVRDASGES
jgi:deoxyribonuclease-4